MNEDFREFFALLNARGVEYLVIGGVAYNHHAPPRATKDIDVWVNPARPNVVAALRAIADFGFPTERVEVDDLAGGERVLMMGRVPNRIDVLTRPKGIEFGPAWARKVIAHYGDVPIGVLAIDDLIASKRAAGRPQDLVDARKLERIRARGRRRDHF